MFIKVEDLNHIYYRWIADNAMKYAKRMQAQSAIKEAEAELAEIKKQLANLINAVAQGIINSTTQDKILALENEQRDAQQRLSLGKRMLPNFTREQIIG